MEKKYIISQDPQDQIVIIDECGKERTLRRIVAITNILLPDAYDKNCYYLIKQGEKGGFIESEKNLSQEGGCWIGDDAKVYENAKIFTNALICGNAQVFGNALVCDFAEVSGNAKVCGDAKIYDCALVNGAARVFGAAKIYNNAQVGCGIPHISGNAQIFGNATVSLNAEVYGNAQIYDSAQVAGKVSIFDYAEVYGNAEVQSGIINNSTKVPGSALNYENAKIIFSADLSNTPAKADDLVDNFDR